MDGLSAVASCISIVQLCGKGLELCSGQHGIEEHERAWAAHLEHLRSICRQLRELLEDQTFDRSPTVAISYGLDEAISASLVPLSRTVDKMALVHGEGILGSSQGKQRAHEWSLKHRVEFLEDSLEMKCHISDLKQILLKLQAGNISTGDLPRADKSIEKFFAWLDFYDPIRDLEHLRSSSDLSPLWLHEDESYLKWRAEMPSLFYLTGRPGSGKSVLSSFIIDDILSLTENLPDTTLSYFFFSMVIPRRNSLEMMLRSVIGQLARRLTATVLTSLSVYTLFESGVEPSIEDLLTALWDIKCQVRELYFVFDAIDELRSSDQVYFKRIVDTLLDGQYTKCHIFLLGRNTGPLTLTFSQRAVYYAKKDLDSILQTQSDVRKFIRGRLHGSPFNLWKNQTGFTDLEDVLVERSQGKSLTARLQVEELESFYTWQQVRDYLKREQTHTYEEAITAALCRLPAYHSGHILKLLYWLVCACKRLSLNELIHAIRFDIVSDTETATNMIQLVNEGFSGLLVSRNPATDELNAAGDDRLIDFAYSGTSEYLCSEAIRKGPAAIYHVDLDIGHTYMTKLCIGRLVLVEEPQLEPDEIPHYTSLKLYCAKSWFEHYKAAHGHDSQSGLHQLIRDFFCNGYFLRWLSLYDPDRAWGGQNGPRQYNDTPPPMYYACRLGLTYVAALLNDQDNADVNAQGGVFPNALYAASIQGFTDTVQLLLQRKADPNIVGGPYANPLQAACSQGHYDNVQMLIEAGALPSRKGGLYGNALQAASHRGNEEIVRLLLRHGCDIDMSGGLYTTALQAAAFSGSITVVETLLAYGIDIHQSCSKHGDALQIASAASNEKLLQLLLHHGLDIHKMHGTYGTALQAAAHGGSEAIVSSLLNLGADINAYGGRYATALQAASFKGYLGIIDVLLSRGSRVNTEGGELGTALHAAATQGHEHCVARLLRAGADVRIKDRKHGTALNAACFNGHLAIVRTLIAANCDPNYSHPECGSPLQASSISGHVELVQLLLDAGADPGAGGGTYRFALYAASCKGHTDIVRLLLRHGADVNQTGDGSGTALYAAALHTTAVTAAGATKQCEVIEELLLRGADPNVVGGEYSNALQAASLTGKQDVVGLLLKAKADVNAIGGVYNTALQAAAHSGFASIVQLLLDSGADVNIRGGQEYGSALYAAACQGYERIVVKLIEAGAEVDLLGGEHRFAINAAWMHDHSKTVEILRRAGAVGSLTELQHGSGTGSTEMNALIVLEDIEKVMKDMEVPQSTLRVAFESQILAAVSLRDEELSIDESIKRHVVMARSKGSSISINEEVNATECATLSQIVEAKWPDDGLQILDSICRLCQCGPQAKSQTCLSVTDEDFSSHCLFFEGDHVILEAMLTNASPRLRLVIDCIDFICRAVRPPLDLSCNERFVVFESTCQVTTRLSREKVTSDSSGKGLTVDLKYSHHAVPLEQTGNDCWRELFVTCNIVGDVTITQQTQTVGRGLELPFDLLVALSTVEYPVDINGGILLVGYHTALILTEISDTHAQFHLEVERTGQINPYSFAHRSIMKMEDVSRLSDLRCFVGWCETAEVKLGTRDLQTMVGYSSAQHKSTSLQLTGISVGFQAVSSAVVQAGVSGSANYSKVSHRVAFTPQTNYVKMLRDNSDEVVLLSDTASRRSWLVPKLSAILHMAHAWFSESRPGPGVADPIPYVDGHSDGSVVADQLQNRGDIIVCGQGKDELKLRTLIVGININLQRTAATKAESHGKELYGFEFLDIVKEPGRGSCMKKVKIKAGRTWVDLANIVEAVIICADLGEAISPANTKTRNKSDCNTLPIGQDYLAAHVSCLRQLIKVRGTYDIQALLQAHGAQLSDKMFLAIMGEPFRECTHESNSRVTCWSREDMFQRITEHGLRAMFVSLSKHTTKPKTIHPTGAVVFGEAAKT